jgi:hypothetical protein
MKKLLLSIVALFMGVSMVNAEEYTVTITGADQVWANTAGKQTGTKDGVTISTGEGLCNGEHYRAYKNKEFTVSVAEGNITKIELTCLANGTTKYGPGCFTGATSGSYSYSGKVGTWVGSAPSVTMTASVNQVRMTEIKVTYEVGTSTAPAVTSIALSEASEVQTLYYESESFNHAGLVATATLEDGTTEEVTDNVTWSYNPAELTIETESVEVTATYKGVSASKTYEVTMKTIANTPETAYTVEEACALIEANRGLGVEVYVKGIVSKVESFNSTHGSITYWISTDGTEESQQFECYSGLNIGGEKFTSVDGLQVGTSVVVVGTMKKYGKVYEFNYNNKIVSVETTGINDIISTDLKDGKIIENNRVVIVKAGKKYNVAGQLVK